jgi:hypothetical protein
MKRVLDFMVNNKYFIIVFSVLVFGLKLVSDKYDLPGGYLPILTTLKTIFLVLFITCMVHVLSFFVFALVSKGKPAPWWEKQGKNRKDPEENLLFKTYFQSLVVSIPLAVYGLLIYLAVYASWQNIVMVMLGFAIVRILNYSQNRMKSGLERDI